MEDTPLASRLHLLSDTYARLSAPLLLLFAIGLATAPTLAWTAGILFAALTINRLASRRVR